MTTPVTGSSNDALFYDVSLFINSCGATYNLSYGPYRTGRIGWEIEKLVSNKNLQTALSRGIVGAGAPPNSTQFKIEGYLGILFCRHSRLFGAFLEELASALRLPKIFAALKGVEIELPYEIYSANSFIRIFNESFILQLAQSNEKLSQKDKLISLPITVGGHEKIISLTFSNAFPVTYGSGTCVSRETNVPPSVQHDLFAAIVLSLSSRLKSIAIDPAASDETSIQICCQCSSLKEMVLSSIGNSRYASGLFAREWEFVLNSVGTALPVNQHNGSNRGKRKRKRRSGSDIGVCTQPGTLISLEKLSMKGIYLADISVFGRFLRALQSNASLKELHMSVGWHRSTDHDDYDDLWQCLLDLIRSNKSLTSIYIEFQPRVRFSPATVYHPFHTEARLQQLHNILSQNNHTLVDLTFYKTPNDRLCPHTPGVQECLDLNYYGLSDFLCSTSDGHAGADPTVTNLRGRSFPEALVDAAEKEENYDSTRFVTKHGKLAPCLFRVLQHNPSLAQLIKFE